MNTVVTAQQRSNLEWLNKATELSFDHPVTKFESIETHISRIVLTGPFAYKIKKPVVFDFVDYSTLELRKHYCEAELELNRQYSHGLYLDVVPISLVDDKPIFGCDLNIVDYAVKMRQFDQSLILSNRTCLSRITGEMIDQFAQHLARIHGEAIRTSEIGNSISRSFENAMTAPVPWSSDTRATAPTGHLQPDAVSAFHDFGSAMQVADDVMTNVRFLVKELTNSPFEKPIRELQEWSDHQCGSLWGLFEVRKRDGCIRKCHGDMHLNNLVLLNNAIVAFDGIEFNEDFQFIDLANDLAFPVMDFVAQQQAGMGWRLLSAYLEASFDYEMLPLFQFYFVYRALVRAKVGLLNSNYQGGRPGPDSDWPAYLEIASQMIESPRPELIITHGFSGSGKSTKATLLVEQKACLRIRTDIVRQTITFADDLDKYSPAARDQVYERTLELAEQILSAGWTVVVDATFLNRHNRVPFQRLAERINIPFSILNCQAPREILEQRILNRQGDPSEANLQVLDNQLRDHDPLSDDELQYCVDVESVEI